MNLRRITASVALSALLLGTTAMPALADKGGHGSDKGRGQKVSEKFEDMGEFEWGLGDVTKMTVKGVFNGRGDKVFAPGAKITLQESAVAIVRLMEKDDAAEELAATEVSSLLSGISDANKIADWAKPSVAMLVKLGVIDDSAPFSPLSDADRLDVAIMLVNALGYQAEAAAKANAKLEFKDAHLIPAEYVGHVKVAVDHKLITGYDDKTFRPNQAVKRVEMAVMLGRADRLIDKEKEDEVKGVVKSVNATGNSLVVTAGGKDVTLTLAQEASIFIDNREKSLADLTVGMKVEVKLNRDGKVVYIEAKSVEAPQDPAVTGSITNLVAATPTSLALVSIGNVAYPLSPRAVIKVNGQTATYADLKVGDNVKAQTTLGLVIKLEVTRAAQTVSGSITAVTPATSGALAKVTLSTTANGTTTSTEYVVAANATVKINGQASQLGNLRISDTATFTLGNNLVTAIDVNRPATQVTGNISGLVAATATTPAKIIVTFPSLTTPAATAEYTLAAGASIKVNGQAAQWADLRTGENATLTLGAGLVDKVEVTRPAQTVSGSIVGMTPATSGALAKITLSTTVNGTTTNTEYVIAANAIVKINGQASQFSNLRISDTATFTIVNNLVTEVAADRRAVEVSGTIAVVTAATAATPAKITVTLATTPVTAAEYILAAGAAIKVNGQAANLADLRNGDAVKLTLGSGLVDKVEVTRAQSIFEGSIIALSAPAAGQNVPVGTIGLISMIYTNNGATTTSTFAVTGTTQVLVNGQAAAYANIQLGDGAKVTLVGDALVKLEIRR
ncbi:MAG TPA: S-layer homology domain-containing protein [Symbiobacteriaceae bacterium]|nr:S-layer homology domain-containing protein [Symbiobacteriaceae bacterium]